MMMENANSISTMDLERAEKELRDLSIELCQPDDVPITISLSCNIGEYICNQLHRLQKVESTSDIDLAAYYSRCIFEAVLMLDYMIRHAPREDTRMVLVEMMQDHVDVVEGVISLLTNGYESTRDLEEYRESLKRNVQESGMKLKRTPRVYELAKTTGADAEYSGLYKLYSKYTHPSAYLLFASRSEEEAETCLSVFRHRSYIYACDAIRTYKEVKTVFGELYESS